MLYLAIVLFSNLLLIISSYSCIEVLGNNPRLLMYLFYINK